MNKDQYFQISKDKNLPNRCPILNICERRAHSIFILSYSRTKESGKSWNQHLIDDGVLNKDFNQVKIPFQGESPGIIGTTNSDYFSVFDLCPEVNLFDSMHTFMSSNKTAWITGSYNKYNKSAEKFVTSEFRHFSECPEFCKHVFDKNSEGNLTQNKANKNDLRLLVADNFESAIHSTMERIRKTTNSEWINNIVMIKGEYHDFRNKEITATLPFDQLRLIKNQLRNRLLNLIDSIE